MLGERQRVVQTVTGRTPRVLGYNVREQTTRTGLRGCVSSVPGHLTLGGFLPAPDKTGSMRQQMTRPIVRAAVWICQQICRCPGFKKHRISPKMSRRGPDLAQGLSAINMPAAPFLLKYPRMGMSKDLTPGLKGQSAWPAGLLPMLRLNQGPKKQFSSRTAWQGP